MISTVRISCMFLSLVFSTTNSLPHNHKDHSPSEPKIKAFHVVPDELDSVPAAKIIAEYASGVKMNEGNELTPTSVKDLPTKVDYPTNAKSLYTVVFFDPDVPSRTDPKRTSVLHWMVTNVPGKNLAKGDTHVAYIGSGPPEGSGLHRYILLVYKQPDKITVSEPRINATTIAGRRDFNMRAFANKYVLGEPIAANFFQAEFDDYVPILHAQFRQ